MYDGTLWDILAAEQTAKRGYAYGSRRPSARRKTAKPTMTPAKPPREPTSMMQGSPQVANKMHAK